MLDDHRRGVGCRLLMAAVAAASGQQAGDSEVSGLFWFRKEKIMTSHRDEVMKGDEEDHEAKIWREKIFGEELMAGRKIRRLLWRKWREEPRHQQLHTQSIRSIAADTLHYFWL